MVVNKIQRRRPKSHELKTLTFLVVLGVVRPAESRTQAKVGQLYVSVQINEDVVGLDVTVDEAHLVDALDGQRQLGHVETRQDLREDTHSDEQAHHVSPGYVVHDEVEALSILERVVETHHPLVVCLGQDVAFCFHVGHLYQHRQVLFYIYSRHNV